MNVDAMLAAMTPAEFAERWASSELEKERAWEPFALLAALIHNLTCTIQAANGIEIKPEDLRQAADFMPKWNDPTAQSATKHGKRRLSAAEAEALDRMRYRGQ